MSTREWVRNNRKLYPNRADLVNACAATCRVTKRRARTLVAQELPKEEPTDYKARSRELEAQLQQALEQLENARKAKGLVIPERTSKRAKPKTFIRLIVNDVHGSHADPNALAALFRDIEHVDVREIVLLGDMMECGGFLTTHVPSYSAQIDEVSYDEDIIATCNFLDKLHIACPNADIHYVEGNHEHRVERWCVDAANTEKPNVQTLMRRLAPRYVLDLDKRGIPYYEQGEMHCGLDTRGTLKLGKVYFVHHVSTAKHACSVALNRYASNVITAHTHRADAAYDNLVHSGLVSCWNFGCLSILSPRWNHTKPSSWSHGYGIQIVNEDNGTFQTVPVSIYKGQSYFTNLLEATR